MQHENKKWDFLCELSVANFIREFIPNSIQCYYRITIIPSSKEFQTVLNVIRDIFPSST